MHIGGVQQLKNSKMLGEDQRRRVMSMTANGVPTILDGRSFQLGSFRKARLSRLSCK